MSRRKTIAELKANGTYRPSRHGARAREEADAVPSADLAELLAESQRTYRECVRVLKTEGLFVKTPNGYKIAHPLVKVRDQAAKDIERLSASTRAADPQESGELPMPERMHVELEAAIGRSPRRAAQDARREF